MGTEPTLGQRPPLLVGLTLVMLVFVSLVGGVFGFFAVILYYHQGTDIEDLGIGWGLGAAAVSGLVWRWLLQARCRSHGLDRLNRFGAWMGLAAGLAVTIVLHGRIMLALGSFTPVFLLYGLAFGGAIGLAAGKVFGLIYERDIRLRTTMSPEPSGGASTPKSTVEASP